MGLCGANIADPVVGGALKKALVSASLLSGCAFIVLILNVIQSGLMGALGGLVGLAVLISILVCQHQAAKPQNLCCAQSSCCGFGCCICWQVFTVLAVLVGLILTSGVESVDCCAECRAFCRYGAANASDDERGGRTPPAAMRSMRLVRFVGGGGEGGEACDGDDYDWGTACDDDCDEHCPFEDPRGARAATSVISLLLAIGMAVCACIGCFNSRRVQMYVSSGEAMGKDAVMADGQPGAQPVGQPIQAAVQGTPLS